MVVLSDSARALLAARYGIRANVDVIPHGVPDFAVHDHRAPGRRSGSVVDG